MTTAANTTKGRKLGTVDEPPPRPGGEPKPLPPFGVSLAILLVVLAVGTAAFLWLWNRDDAGTGWLVLFGTLFAAYSLNRSLPGLRERSALRRSRREAGRLAKSVRKSLRKQGHWLSNEAKDDLESRASTVEQVLPGTDLAAIEFAARQLDEAADKHLSRKPVAREYVEQIGGAILLALFVRAFFYEAFKIPSPSMVPTLMVGDHLFVNKFVYGLRIPFTLQKLGARYPERGDIVVFNKPGDEEGDDVIKRVVGLPGDVVRVQNRRISVNGEPLPTSTLGVVRRNYEGDEPYGSERGRYEEYEQFEERIGHVSHLSLARLDGFDQGEGTWVVEPGHVFVMGDNRDNSLDSRFPRGPGGAFGQIPLDYIKGRADVIWLSIRSDWKLRFDRMFSRID